MNTPAAPSRDLHSPSPFGKVVSLDQFRATHTKRKDARRTAPIHSRPRNDDPPPREA